ncbi:hypothetical protein LINPERPRIM_LOCUS40378 [Linum perenne]
MPNWIQLPLYNLIKLLEQPILHYQNPTHQPCSSSSYPSGKHPSLQRLSPPCTYSSEP